MDRIKEDYLNANDFSTLKENRIGALGFKLKLNWRNYVKTINGKAIPQGWFYISVYKPVTVSQSYVEDWT